MSTDGVVGGGFLPTDGQVDPAQLTYSLAAAARGLGVTDPPAHARARHRHGARAGVDAACAPTGATSSASSSSTAAACSRRRSRRMVDVRVPIVPMSHQYVVTEAMFEHREAPLPSLRDPDLLVYYRQEVDGLVMGGYERASRPWTASPSSYDDIPADFNGRLLPRTGTGSRRSPTTRACACRRWPTPGSARSSTGPEAFTPDNEFCLGETEVAGLLRRGRLLRARDRRRGRHRQGDGRVDPRRRAADGPVAHGRPPLRRGVPLAVVHAGPHGRELRDLLRHPLPGHERSAGRPLRTSPAYAWHARRTARVRREVRLGAGQLLRVERRRRRRGAAAARLGRAALVARDRPEHRAARETAACSTSRPSPRSR